MTSLFSNEAFKGVVQDVEHLPRQEMTSVFSNEAFNGHELVAFRHDQDSGLKAIIAVHDRTLGPAAGGCRMHPYASEAEALRDALRLSQGMTRKSALAGLPFGGGKAVIIGDPRQDKTERLLASMGDFVESLGGRYLTGEDSGIGVDDIRVMATRTAHVGGLQSGAEHGGDPSPTTAFGVYLAMRAAVGHRLGRDTMDGLRVAIQGLGQVGLHLAGLLTADGARVFGTDVQADLISRAVAKFGIAPVADPAEILATPADVFAPCALGAILNRTSIAGLKAAIVAGAANNQLATAGDGDRLHQRGILYCPDFLINAGGIIDIHHQRLGSSRTRMRAHVQRIPDTLLEVIRRSEAAGCSPARIADEIADEIVNCARSEPMTDRSRPGKAVQIQAAAG